MDSQKKDLGLILAIVFASAVISGSLVFFGIKASGTGSCDVISSDKIEEAFGNFVKKQQEQQQGQQQVAQEEANKKAADVAKQNLKPVTSADYVRGNKDAKITLVQYSDFECPYCKKFHPVGQQIMAAYSNDVNWVYRHFPLDFHNPMATKEAEASECAGELGGNEGFWKFVDGIYEKTQSGGNGLTEDDLVTIAGGIGLDQTAFSSCLSSGKYEAKVKQDTAEGGKAGITGTPGNIFINNKTGEVRVMNGAQEFDTFKGLIDEMLAQ